MIEGTGNHLQARSRLLVERPETRVIKIEILRQGLCDLVEQYTGSRLVGGKKIVVNSPGGPNAPVENVRRGVDDVFFDPRVSLIVDEYHASVLDGLPETLKGTTRCILIAVVARFQIRPEEQRDALSLREARIPRSLERVPVFPVEVMVPDPHALTILFHVGNQPVTGGEKFLAAGLFLVTREEIVVPQPVLSYGDRVVLQTDRAVIVESGNALCVVVTGEICFGREPHVVLTQLVCLRVGIQFGYFMPEGQMALAGQQVCTKNAPIV